MKIYNYGSHGAGTVFVSPGTHHPENSNWVDEKTRAPKMFTVRFRDGVADVDTGIAMYMVARKLAKSSPIITGVAA